MLLISDKNRFHVVQVAICNKLVIRKSLRKSSLKMAYSNAGPLPKMHSLEYFTTTILPNISAVCPECEVDNKLFSVTYFSLTIP